PDVEEDLVLVDFDNRSLDDVAVVEVDDRAGDGVLEGHAFQVVVDHLLGDVVPAGVFGEGSFGWRFGGFGGLLVGLLGHVLGSPLSGLPSPPPWGPVEGRREATPPSSAPDLTRAFPRRPAIRGARGRAAGIRIARARRPTDPVP